MPSTVELTGLLEISDFELHIHRDKRIYHSSQISENISHSFVCVQRFS
jgi:hypothetical protein